MKKRSTVGGLDAHKVSINVALFLACEAVPTSEVDRRGHEAALAA